MGFGFTPSMIISKMKENVGQQPFSMAQMRWAKIDRRFQFWQHACSLWRDETKLLLVYLKTFVLLHLSKHSLAVCCSFVGWNLLCIFVIGWMRVVLLTLMPSYIHTNLRPQSTVLKFEDKVTVNGLRCCLAGIFIAIITVLHFAVSHVKQLSIAQLLKNIFCLGLE